MRSEGICSFALGLTKTYREQDGCPRFAKAYLG
jgi:hypothetical protein